MGFYFENGIDIVIFGITVSTIYGKSSKHFTGKLVEQNGDNQV
ncbi:hypothetical protein V6B14_01725 [Sporosarcina psychrophila]